MTEFSSLLSEVRRCTICASALPQEPRPVVQAHPEAKILIAGQAPGRKVHNSGVPFDDASGKRLREWLGLTREEFYDPQKVAILPMGFCFPGTGKTGDLAPRKECAPAWRSKILAHLKQIELTIVLGSYAQKYHLDDTNASVTQLVKSWRSLWPNIVPLPHPSPRNNIWLKKNPWFEIELLPTLRLRIAESLKENNS
ncbi:uracil-DNA glycosylase family protein [Colwellia psychrerythraea]|uniref:Uracil-DNA glycosylase superfamily n=1 Tax=Colwellia psychrerythraea TaxID=28229 RepID=A0A099KZX3_COLPS|nr:uracil-DNA glycosylase family protein [Colwellia psychrerythraea]KGJ95158.1 Uracil-DNA glycosylase superfamily [Colwellia psychrerythraea]